ncbi:MAG: autotransporter-associated beta strand repeat-containing protein, partial [Thermoguttaceae bacterium]
TEVKLGGSTLTTGDNTSTTFAGTITSASGGSLTKTGAGTFTLRGSNTFSGGVHFNAGLINAASLSNLGAGALSFNGGGLQFGAAFDPSLDNRTITFQAGGATLDTQAYNVTVSKAIGNGGAGGLTKQGSGMLTLSASPNYTGPTVISAGTLQLASGATLPAATAVNLTASGAILDDNAISQTIASLTGVAGTEVKLGGSTLTTGNSASTTFAGAITSASGGSLTKTGAGTFTLRGSNTFSGAVNFNAGLINAAGLSNLGAGALNFNGGGLQFGAAFDPSLDNRTITFQAGGATLDTQAYNVAVSKAIGNGGAGGLTKSGSGILELDGTVSYSGATSINAGVLKINNQQSTTLSAISGAGKLEVDGAGTVLTASSLNVNTLTLGAGSVVVIAPIAGGPPIGQQLQLVPLPEPSALVLLGIGALAMLFAARRKR